MNIKLALFFFLMTLTHSSYALYGAQKLSGSTFDAVVTLHLNDPDHPEYDSFCSGVLVAPDKVLTTGHCVEVLATEVYEQWNLFAYEPDLIKVKIKGTKVDVADVILAPGYTEAPGYEGEDLALIKLKKSITNVRPFKLAQRSSLRLSEKATLVAKGKLAETSIKSIKSYAGNYVIVTDGSRSGVCEGDSGGALLVKRNNEFVLAGLLSATEEGCKKSNSVSIFPRIFK